MSPRPLASAFDGAFFSFGRASTLSCSASAASSYFFSSRDYSASALTFLASATFSFGISGMMIAGVSTTTGFDPTDPELLPDGPFV
jgi:hypothetical protein